MTTNRLTFLILPFCLFLFGCRTTLPNKSSQNYNINTPTGTGVIVGKLSFAISGGSYTVSLKNLNTNKIYNIRERDGAFEWKKAENGYLNKFFCIELPAAAYSIISASIIDQAMYASDVKTDFSLMVHKNKITYVGTLKYDWEQTDNYLLWKKGKSYFQIIDEFSSVENEIKIQCPWLSDQEISKDLIM